MDEAKKVHFGSWEQLKIGGQPPSSRYSQAAVLLQDTIYLFGGASSTEDGSTLYHGDFFALNLTVSPLEWSTIQQQGDVPSAREGAHLNVLDGKVYLYGGIESETARTCAEGLFSFSPDSGLWAKVHTQGPAPTTQSSTCVLYDRKLLTFGGIISGKAQNSVQLFTFDTSEWTDVKTTGAIPPPRCDHVTAVLRGKLFTSCGSGRDDLWFNDIHCLDLATWQWTQLNPKGGVTPSPRDYATVSVFNNKYIVQFGGFSGESGEEECFADIHYVDFSSSDFEWHSVTVSGDVLPARYAHSAVAYKEKLYIIAGQNTEEEFSDVWSITIKAPSSDVSFEPVPLPRARYSTSTPVPAPRKVIAPAPPPPIKPRDLEDLRTKYVKKINTIFDTLTERFQQLDKATATLESERAAFESEKKAHNELYEKQQQELDEMLKHHKQENEEWVSQMHSELTSERKALAEEKAAAEAASAALAKQQEIFQQKSNKLDAIMRQVQGLKD